MSPSGQDAEEAAELMATMRAEHPAMKAWYNDPSNGNGSGGLAALRDRHGPTFPGTGGRRSGGSTCGSRRARPGEGAEAEAGGGGNGNNQRGRSRRKRSRWAVAPDAGDDNKHSRWANGGVVPASAPPPPAPAAPADPVMAALGLAGPVAPGGMGGAALASSVPEHHRAELVGLQSRLKKANARLSDLGREAARIDALPRGHPDRSPSPPPVYGPDGTRRNTRANRWREKYGEERAQCLERIADLVPALRVPGTIGRRKRSRKIVIPVEEYPTYNFIGLIIGPRGKTQKDMEGKTGCKIAIRGKGSVKEGAKGRRNGQPMEGDDEPLHVLITGEDPAAVDAAAEMINSMLVVIDDELNVHKQNQLRELALLNGTLKDEEWCHVCGDKGHRDFECPKRFAMGGRSKVLVKCAICGDTSHPTRDCAMKKEGAEGDGEDGAKKEMQLDSDYMSFMAELDGKKVPEKGAVCIPAPSPMGGGGGSFLTVIQPARVVDKNAGGEDTPAGVAPGAVPPPPPPGGTSFVTTISTDRDLPPAAPAPPRAEVPAVAPAGSVEAPATPSAGATAGGSFEASLPPPPAGIPPPPAGAAAGVPPPPAGVPPPPAGVPPPPVGVPPPPPGGLPPPPPGGPPGGMPGGAPGAYPPPPVGGYPYQQPYGQPLGGMGYGQPPPPPPGGYGYPQQQQNPYGAQQQQQWRGGGGTGETAGWDPRSFYGAGGDGGAGGFNWWDQSS
ncbi:hypothetical protein ACHAWF_016221 [Thalassiosira exigua]